MNFKTRVEGDDSERLNRQCSGIMDDLTESSFLAMCEHEYIAGLIGVTLEDDRHAAIVMPLYKLGSLEHYIKDTKNEIKFIQALKFGWQLALGFEYLVSKNSKLAYNVIILLA